MLNGWRLLKQGESCIEFPGFPPAAIICFLFCKGCGGYRNTLPRGVGKGLATSMLNKAFSSNLES